MSVVSYRGRTLPGQAGTPVIGLVTNSFKVSTPTKSLEQYDAILLPGGRTNKENELEPAESKKTKPVPKRFFRPVIDYLQKYSQHSHLFKPPGAYDGMHSFYIAESKIAQGGNFPFTMPGSSQTEQGRGPNDPEQTYVVTLKHVARIDPRHVLETVSGSSSPDSSLQIINAINAVIRMVPLERAQDFSFATKRAFFRPERPIHLGGGLDLLIGIFSSLRPQMRTLSLNIDTTSVVTFRKGPLYEFIWDVFGLRDMRRLEPEQLNIRQVQEVLIPLFKRLKVVYSPKHPLYARNTTAGLPKRFGIAGITKVGADRYKFSIADPARNTSHYVSVEEYFFTKYNVRLQFPKAFCVRLKNTRPGGDEIVMPLELLDVPQGQVYKSALDASAAQNMIKETTRRPQQRLDALQQGFSDLGFNTSGTVGNTGITIAPRVQGAAARLLQNPLVHFGGERGPTSVPATEGGWDAKKKTFNVRARILGWAIVILDRQYSQSRQDIKSNLAVPLRETLKNRGLIIKTDPLVYPLADINLGAIENSLNGVVTDIMNDSTEQAHRSGWKPSSPGQRPLGPSEILIVCVLKLPDSNVRASIKIWGDVQQGVATQIIVGGKIRTPQAVDNQYLNNVALKINIKMGGINSTVNNGWFDQHVKARRRTMIVGADVSHPSPGSMAPSIAAIVYNTGPDTLSDYRAACSVQNSRGEIIQDFAAMMQEAIAVHEQRLRSFMKEAPPDGYLPHHIVIFRDGVSEGEFSSVANSELRSLKELLSKIRSPFAPKITFAVVGKRHHIRFFPSGATPPQQKNPKNGNFPSGLVVDNEIVHPLFRDFYLQSQKPLMGTSRPSHYTVLADEIGMSSDDLQRLCFDLCHVFCRSTTAVSIPAPVYYADLVCARARLHLSREEFSSEGSVNEDLNAGILDAPTRATLNQACRVHDRQKKRMYFV